MFAHTWLTAAALAAAPVPTSPRDSALELYDKGAFLEASELAIAGYLSPASPAGKRLQSARLAQEALSKAYETSVASTSRPEYLCRALDVLDATAPLAVTAEDIRLHTVLAARHRATLAERHPEHTCKTGTELRPILAKAQARAPAPVMSTEPGPGTPRYTTNTFVTVVVPQCPPAIRRYSASASLKMAGAVSLSVGVAAFAVMAGGLSLRTHAMKAAQPLDAAQKQQGGFLTEEQARALVPLVESDDTGKQLVLAGGISGAMLLVIGAALVGRGYVGASRARVSPMAGPGKAGFAIQGTF